MNYNVGKKLLSILIVIALALGSFSTVLAAETPENTAMENAAVEAPDSAEPPETQPDGAEAGEEGATVQPDVTAEAPGDDAPQEPVAQEDSANLPQEALEAAEAVTEEIAGEGVVPEGELLPVEEELPPVNEESTEFVTGEILVTFEDRVTDDQAMAVLEEHNALPQDDQLNSNEVNVVDIPEYQTVDDAVQEMQADPDVKHAQPNFLYYLLEEDESGTQYVPVDGDAEDKYQLAMSNLYAAWDISRAEGKVKVAVLDSGIMYNHTDLKDNIVDAYDAVNDVPITAETATPDPQGHGTHVAGIVAGVADNGKGITGVSFNAGIIAVNVFRPVSGGYSASTADILNGFDYAMGKGARVVNMSLGGYRSSGPTDNDTLLESAINMAAARGVVTVCAAGNGLNGVPQTQKIYPGDFDACISVVAVDRNKLRRPFGDYNAFKDISAAGEAIYSTANNGDYGYKSGSSMASPVVAGIVALMIAKNPKLTVDQIKEALYATAGDTAGSTGGVHTEYYGYGLADAKAALDYITGAHETPTGKLVTGISLGAADGARTVPLNGTLQINAAISPVDADDPTLEWSVIPLTSTEKVTGGATISASGLLTPTAVGPVRIVAKSTDGGQAYAYYTVTVVPAAVTAQVYLTAVDAVQVSWPASTGAKGYELWQSESQDGTYTKVTAANETTLTRQITGLERGKTYYFKVIPYVLVGGKTYYGADSAIVSKSILTQAAVTGVAAAASSMQSVNVTWTAVPGADGYEVESSTGDTFTTTADSYEQTGLTQGLGYFYKVRAYCMVNAAKVYTDYSAEVSALIPLPAEVTDAQVVLTAANAVRLQWTAVSGMAGYEVLRAEQPTGTYTKVTAADETGVTRELTGLGYGKTYYFKVLPYIVQGGVKFYGSSNMVSETTMPQTVSGVVAEVTGEQSIKVTWAAASGVDGYEVSSSQGGPFTTTATSYEQTGLTRGQSYTYKVRAYRMVNAAKKYNDYSTEVSRRVPPQIAATNAQVSLSAANAVQLTWSAVHGVTGYEVWRTEQPGGTYTKISTVTGDTIQDYADLQYGKTYYFKVRPYITEDGTTFYGEDSNIVSETTMSQKVSGVTAEAAGMQSINVTWSAVPGADGYEIIRSSGGSVTVLAASYQHTGLNPGANYTYKVRAYRRVNESKIYNDYSAEVSANTLLPEAAAGLQATLTAANTVQLQWAAVANVDGYELRQSEQQDGKYTKVSAANEAAVVRSLSGLAYGKTSYYKVFPYVIVGGIKYYAAGSGVASETTMARTVSDVAATVTGAHSVNVTWSAVAGANGYEVKNSTGGLLDVKSTNYAQTGLATGTNYSYQIRAYRVINNVKIYNDYSETVTAAPRLIATVKDLQVKLTAANSVQLNWTALPDATGYELWQSNAKDGVYTKVSAVNEGTTIRQLSALQYNKTYYYKILPYVEESGVKYYAAVSNLVNVATMPQTVPALKAAATGTGSVKVTWSAVSGASGYQVKSSTGKMYTTTALSYQENGLVTGTSYSYSVRAYRTVGSTNIYNNYSAAVSTRTQLTAVTGAKATVTGAKSVRISWGQTKNATGYEVWRATSQNGTYSRIAVVGGGNTLRCDKAGLTPGATYYFKVRAMLGSLYGPYSAVVSAKPAPKTVSGLTVQATSATAAKISWKKVAGADGYEVYRKKGSGSYSLASTVLGESKVAIGHSGLATKTTYSYRVRAYALKAGKKVYGAFSAVASVTPVAKIPASVQVVSAKSRTATITWGSVSGVKGFEVYRSESKDGRYKKIKTLSNGTRKFTDTGLTSGKAYYYKVCGIVAVGNRNFSGALSVARGVRPR